MARFTSDVHGRVDPRVDKERIGTVEVVVLRWNNVADSFTGTQASIKVNTNNKTKTQTQEPGAQKSRSKKHVTFAPEESNKGESSGLLDGARGSDSDDHTALWLSQMDGTYESLPMRDKGNSTLLSPVLAVIAGEYLADTYRPCKWPSYQALGWRASEKLSTLWAQSHSALSR